jgi:hypothetical protein
MKIKIVPSNTLDERKKKKKKKSKAKKDDRCTRIAKRKYKVWPSAYASGAVVQCRRGKIWKGLKEGQEDALEAAEEAILAKLKAEGGAAGLEPLEKAVEKLKLPEDFNIVDFLDKLESVGQHDDGDYYSVQGLEEGEVIDFPEQTPTDENLELVNQLFKDFNELQDVYNKNEIGAVLTLNIRQLRKDQLDKIDPDIDVDALEVKYGDIADELENAMDEEIIELYEAKKKRKKRKKAGTESSKEKSLRDWFGRKGAKGSTGGWVDCNAPDGKGGYKSCGRQKGEKRKKYPACRPTPAACKERGKGKSWGKKAKKKKKIKEAAKDYVYGVKNPGRVANKYKIKVVKP